jgi:arabinofuranosyltransferase
MNRRALIRAAVAALALVAAYAATAWYVGAGIVDDTYIFLRYARNIVEGIGPAFNAGEPVEGFTSPTWLAVLTAISWTSLDPPSSAVACSAALGFAVVLLVGWSVDRRSRSAGLLAAGFLATSPSFVFWCWSGLDSALFTLLLVATFVSFAHGGTSTSGRFRTGMLLAAAALTRLEAVWMLPLFVYQVMRCSGRRGTSHIVALTAPTLLLLGTYEVWRLVYYDSWLPNTFYAKADVPRLTLLRHGLVYARLALLYFAPLAIFATREFRRPLARLPYERLLVLALAWWTCYVILIGGDHFALFRFFVPALAVFALAAARLVAAAETDRRLGSNRVRAAAGIALLATNLFLFVSPQVRGGRIEVREAQGWADTGRWCNSYLPPGSIASLVVGAIPYYCDRVTYDLLGLVDAHVARSGKVFSEAAVGHQRYATDYILSREPRYIFFTSSGLSARPSFADPESRRRLPKRTNWALIDLTTHPTVLRDYRYRAEILPNGRWVEFLERR